MINLRTLNENHDDGKARPSKNMALILRRFASDCEEDYDNSFHFEQVREHQNQENKKKQSIVVFYLACC